MTAQPRQSRPPPPVHPAPPTLAAVFVRFLRFGMLAWGGPVAQIGMLRHELVDRQRIVEPAHFNRVLAVYQALPGPEATELCVFFGQRLRGRAGGLVAGLGFVLPGFVLMLACSWAYVRFGAGAALASPAFLALQAGAAALVLVGAARIARHAAGTRLLLVIAVVAAVLTLAGVHFVAVLAAGGGATVAHALHRGWARRAIAVALTVSMAMALLLRGAGTASLLGDRQLDADGHGAAIAAAAGTASVPELVLWGLLAGSLTFGGAYTVIPFVRSAAVVQGRWITDEQLLHGIAIGSVLPAPLVIFTTFVGYLAGGLAGAVSFTAATFAPAFAITLLGHELLERAVASPRLHAFLDGVAAAVAGVVTMTAGALAVLALQPPEVSWPAASHTAKVALAAVGMAITLAAVTRLRGGWVVPASLVAVAVLGAAAGLASDAMG